MNINIRNYSVTSKWRKGLSLIEVIVAISIIAIMFAVLTPALIDNSKRTAGTGQITQAASMLNFFVRQIVGGNAQVLADNTPISWGYGALSSSTLGLNTEKDLGNPDLYKVTISNQGEVTVLTASATQYQVDVCFQQGSEETCINAKTLGPAPTDTGIGRILPGIN
ncbi:MAG: prepilin-type N-terminal cleavage/methylation domain-containing protein [Trueperaceae bacterium]|nr:prepilin-type N-terminal cleavage/methylation domain-containing protein [Trueperaceae bacterium]